MSDSIKHQGEWLETEWEKSGLTLEAVSGITGKNRTTLWRWFKKEFLKPKDLKMVADALKLDLRDHFEEMEYLYVSDLKSNEIYRSKYLDLLEKYHNLLEKYEDLKGPEKGQNEA